MHIATEHLLQLLLVFIVGGLVGAEREYRSKSAGFRTMILICLGSFLFTHFSQSIGGNNTDRIASNIVTGIGFLGAGVIFRSEGSVNGLTTAAAVWVTGALGMGIADKQYWAVGAGTVALLLSMIVFNGLEQKIEKWNQTRRYRIVRTYQEDLFDKYELWFEECGLKHSVQKQTRAGNEITAVWTVHGTKKAHKKFVAKLLHDESVKLFEF